MAVAPSATLLPRAPRSPPRSPPLAPGPLSFSLPRTSYAPAPSLSPAPAPPLALRASRRPLCCLALSVSALVLGAAASRRLLPPSPLAAPLLLLSRLQRSRGLGPGALEGGISPGSSSPGGPARTFSTAAMANVTIGTPAQKTITIPATQDHKATVIFLHGLGDTGEGWSDIPGMLMLPNIKWVLPSAPIVPVSVNGGFPCPSWFDIFGLSADAKEDATGIDKAARYVAGILEKEKASSPEGTKFIVGGFSQGGALSLHLAARKQLGKFLDGSDATTVPIDGTICLSGWLPMGKTLVGQSLASPEAAAKYPLLMCHGQADPLVQFPFGTMSGEVLKTLGFTSLAFKSYRGLAHSASPEELQDVRQWLSSLI